MKTIIAAVLVVLACVVALSVTVPDEPSFHRHLAKIDANDAEDSLMQRAGDSITRTQVKLTADYQSHVLWATVEATRGTDKQRWLGAMGVWVQLSDSVDR